DHVNENVEQVIAEIFGQETGWIIPTGSPEQAELSAGYDDVKALAELLANDPAEEQLQEFLQRRPRLLMGFAGWRYSGDLAFLVKPPISTQFNADFGILQSDQSGAHVV